jgi:hypothetical protein
MRKHPYLVSTLLTLEVGALCLIAQLIRTFAPGVILPRTSLPLLVLLSLIPQILELYLAPNVHPPLLSTTVLAGVTFSLLPLCANVDTGLSAWAMLLAGTAVFGAVSLLYSSLARRMAASASGPFTPAAQGLCLYLASQCLQGLI